MAFDLELLIDDLNFLYALYFLFSGVDFIKVKFNIYKFILIYVSKRNLKFNLRKIIYILAL